MTIKNTRKDISSEPGDIVLSISKNTPALKNGNANENYSTNLILTLVKQDQYGEVVDEDSYQEAVEENSWDLNYDGKDIASYNVPSAQRITIPLSELVRLKYLENQYYNKTTSDDRYYTKTEVDNKIKPTYMVVNSVPELSIVKRDGLENYTFLVPDENPDEHNYFIEYRYIIDENGNNERIEQVGSTRVNLSDYVTNDEFGPLSDDVSLLTSRVDVIETNINTNELEIFYDSNGHYILSSDGENAFGETITVPTKTSELTNDSGFLTNQNISGKADKSEIPTTTSQLVNNSDFITSQALNNYYTKTEIDTLIGTLSQLQQQTLNIL